MTVHMVRLQIEPPKEDIKTAVNNWVQNHPEWTDDPEAQSLGETDTGTLGDSGVRYIRGDFRFKETVDRAVLLDDLQTRLQPLPDNPWWRMRWHRCHRDEANPGDCEFDPDKTRQTDDVPTKVP